MISYLEEIHSFAGLPSALIVYAEFTIPASEFGSPQALERGRDHCA
jgi:hypothetical protein